MAVYHRTGDRKYLEPIQRALAYLKRLQLPNGRLARFYELKTNRPLYFTRDYALAYDDSDVPTHYAFKVSSGLDAIEREYLKLRDLAADELRPEPDRVRRPSDAAVRRIIAGLDPRGGWVTSDRLRYQSYEGPILDMRVAVRHLNDLAAYLAATLP